ncbi:phospholipase A [Deefgea piscis]|uniref:Phospholipase A1 n=1 Tax=Deefgea piscis TaxID=2739061 RepID=A0A6M8SPS9_9NEIS|nr:phospholipase A [Deefgea piscis]QKJ66154.1 phospholipase A [Deefgea piscis]
MKAILSLAALLAAASAQATDLAACQQIADNQNRLACYDQLAKQPSQQPSVVEPIAAIPVAPAATTLATPAQPVSTAETFSQRWELSAQDQDGVFNIKPYQPVYILPVSWRKRVNNDPCSPNPLNCSHRGDQDYGKVETKFQLSFKTKLVQDAFGSDVDVWGAYTQQSYWQAYDSQNSSPFRETDYQPELWATFPVQAGPEWLKLRMINLGAMHQSNGQTNPLSRSWNRLYASFGLTSGDVSVLIKPWWRVPEPASTDNNPDISDYVGRVETVVVYPWQNHVFSLTWRNNLKFGSGTPNRSNIQLEWAFPITGKLHGYVQAFNGWGDSLQNYNFHNSGAAIGVSLVEWR